MKRSKLSDLGYILLLGLIVFIVSYFCYPISQVNSSVDAVSILPGKVFYSSEGDDKFARFNDPLTSVSVSVGKGIVDGLVVSSEKNVVVFLSGDDKFSFVCLTVDTIYSTYFSYYFYDLEAFEDEEA